ncbi:hypothetical protein Pmani_030410 [Petrolisthes manimaculis]|uniref:RNA-binding region-containing protein 3 n=1 Tax=Petrolisthes manimaculis TaxID=1843537 RepID=A0AAE1NVL1_9EUCA|nr:hypothetical protein Pmani_030410 [Petrolisthes manimaculis]
MSCELKVWSFAKGITNKDKEDLLKHFGALCVEHVMVRRGRDGAVRARFKSEVECEYALHKLHQLKILGVRLIAAYCNSSSHVLSEQPHRTQESNTKEDTSQQDKIEKKVRLLESRLCGIGPKVGVNHPIPSTLRYLYPPPSPSVVANISQTLVAVPKFYTQVLHLMNKMNLPVPFGQLFELPSVYEDVLKLLGYTERKKERGNRIPEENICNVNSGALDKENFERKETEDEKMSPLRETITRSSSSSESESELESDDNPDHQTINTVPVLPIKRKIRPKHTINKRPKLSQLQQTLVPHQRTSEPASVRDVFETEKSHEPRKFQLNLQGTVLPDKEPESQGIITLQEGGFGKMEASVDDKKTVDESERSMEEWREKSKYITKEELTSNMVAKTDWPILPVYKNYNPGEPSPKIYIKNLAKTTNEDHLKHIYGRYIFWHNEEEVGMFNIRLMKEGRMKGQAFVTFPTEKQAIEALNDTNGYILNDKPMVVVFGKVKSAST